MSVMTIQRSISEEPPKIENPQRRAPMATPLAKRHTQPTPKTPNQVTPDHNNKDKQHNNVEPGSKAISVHQTLGTPLLLDTQALGQESPALSSNTTKARFRAISALLLWAVAALLGVTVGSTVQAMRAMHAATAARPQMSLDFILRLARADNRCLGVVDVKAQSQVVLQTCSASGAQQFLLLKKATFDQGLMMLCA
mmetsp:Transcript_95480/g.189247  ORF Transcript_95480/g.189247 Transcript_95480/m.189247 type:complete len:196 (+) Transcript_95480:69-656(+)